jgi:BirA family transcriptional regulator, biotin operon repressor / biotin---[acetyl-CoA-carboxylase] ligase
VAAPERATVRWFDALPSTQEVAHRLAGEGAPHGTGVAAREQTSGRGTRGRAWHSPIGGLWMSVICRPGKAAPATCFSLRAGLAAALAIEAAYPGTPTLQLKWPNDVYLHGRKLAGVLCEARWQGDSLAWIVTGIGVNVANAVPDELTGTAATLREVAPGATPEALAEGLAAAIATAAETGGPLHEPEMINFARRDYLSGRRLGAPVEGVAVGIAATGELLVRDDHGVVHRVLEARVELAGG